MKLIRIIDFDKSEYRRRIWLPSLIFAVCALLTQYFQIRYENIRKEQQVKLHGYQREILLLKKERGLS